MLLVVDLELDVAVVVVGNAAGDERGGVARADR